MSMYIWFENDAMKFYPVKIDLLASIAIDNISIAVVPWQCILAGKWFLSSNANYTEKGHVLEEKKYWKRVFFHPGNNDTCLFSE